MKPLGEEHRERQADGSDAQDVGYRARDTALPSVLPDYFMRRPEVPVYAQVQGLDKLAVAL